MLSGPPATAPQPNGSLPLCFLVPRAAQARGGGDEYAQNNESDPHISQKSAGYGHNELNARYANESQSRVELWLKSELGVKGSCKDFVEAHLAEKCQNRSAAEKKFKWDMSMFIIYSIFLILYSFSACSTNTKGKYQVRSMLESEIGFFDEVQETGEHY